MDNPVSRLQGFFRLVQNVTLLGVSVLAALFLLEVLARLIFGPVPQDQLRGYVVTDEQLGFRLKDNFRRSAGFGQIPVWTNELGCFDVPYKGEEPYILLLGDSFMWGCNRFEQNSATLLEELLHTRVVKCGVFCYGTRQELILGERVVRQIGRPPRLIIVGYSALNDMVDDYLFPGKTEINGDLVQQVVFRYSDGARWHYNREDLRRDLKVGHGKFFTKSPRAFKHWLVRNSRLYSLLRSKKIVRDIGEFLHLTHPLPPQSQELEFIIPENAPYLQQMWQEHADAIGQFQMFARSQNARLLFVFAPFKEQVFRDMQDPSFPLSDVHGKVRAFLEKNGITYLDLLPSFEKAASRDLYMSGDIHWAPAGEKLAAQEIAGFILKNNLLAPLEKEKEAQ